MAANCLLCLTVAGVGLLYLSSIAGTVLQWLVYIYLRDAGIQSTNDLSLAAAILSSWETLFGVLCGPGISTAKEQAVRIIWLIILGLPKMVASILNIVIISTHALNGCTDCTSYPATAEEQLVKSLLISALFLEVCCMLIAVTVLLTVCEYCKKKSDRNGYKSLNCTDCLLCPIYATVGVFYFSSTAAAVLQWLVYINQRDAGIKYTNNLSFAAAILSSLGALLAVLCAPVTTAVKEKAVKLCCNALLLLPKLVALILNLAVAGTHASNGCTDCTPDPTSAEGQVIRNLLLSALSLELCCVIIPSTATILLWCIPTGRNMYKSLN